MGYHVKHLCKACLFVPTVKTLFELTKFNSLVPSTWVYQWLLFHNSALYVLKFSSVDPAMDNTALETEADFTGADTARSIQSCQRPSLGCECKNPKGPDKPPNGVLHPVTDRKLQRQVFLCGPCHDYMLSKAGTVTRVRTPQTLPCNCSLMQTEGRLLLLILPSTYLRTGANYPNT